MEAVFSEPQVAQAGDLRAYQGGYFRVLVAPEQTGYDFSLIEFTLPRGAEPPRHLHTREDETFYLLEGEITFCVGDDVVQARPGHTVFAPRQVPHQFTITSPQARMLSLVTPGHFFHFFLGQSTPLAAPCALTSPKGFPPAAQMQAMVRMLEADYGVLFL